MLFLSLPGSALAQGAIARSVIVLLCLFAASCTTPSSGPPPAKPPDSASLAAELADWSRHFEPSLSPPSVGNALQTAQPLAQQLSIATHQISVDAVQTPLESLLFALAMDAGLEFELHDSLPSLVTLRAESSDLDHILNRLASQHPMRWELRNSVLHVWDGSPYTASYNVNYLNINRSTQSSVGLATQVGTINASDNSGTSGTANNSQTLVESSAEHRFWPSLHTDLEHLLSSDNTSDVPSFSMNQDAGLVTVHAGADTQHKIKNYLDKLNNSAQRQVLIEATVVEVALSDRFEAGVDWQLLADGVSGLSAAQVFTGKPQVTADSVNRLNVPNGLVSLVQRNQYGDIRGTLSLLEQFGDVRILSRPRIIALNNQSSVLKVVDNRVYFTVSIERERTADRDEVVTETEIHTVPVGLVMNVTPFISSNNMVMLNVRPTLSRILGFVDDPNPELAAANVRNGVPEIQVREMESMLRVASGDVAIIGGLMQDTVEEGDRRLPGLASLPLLRHLFSQTSRSRNQTELLIVLRPTVMPPGKTSNGLAMFGG